MDIPNANTILIDRADRFGLAELYQLRGRVGRASCQAYAYLLLPNQAGIDPIARKRIQAITQHSALGAGFRLALRDLEIRGAGNLLGSEQSGHIGAVGFGLYCQLLKRTIARQKGETLPPLAEIELRLDFIDLTPASAAADNSAAIPVDYIDDERLRVSLYRKIAECSRATEVDRLRDEFADRFGPRPPAVERLLLMARLRIAAAGRGLTSLETREERILASRGGQLALLEDGLLPRLKTKAPAARLRELIRIVGQL
jgi:transcription-repair coupling factor (superfamily II helicase)